MWGGLASVNLWGLAECGYGKPPHALLLGSGILTRQREFLAFLFGCVCYGANVVEVQI